MRNCPFKGDTQGFCPPSEMELHPVFSRGIWYSSCDPQGDSKHMYVGLRAFPHQAAETAHAPPSEVKAMIWGHNYFGGHVLFYGDSPHRSQKLPIWTTYSL